MTMAGWHAESSKPVAWENNKIELGGEIVRSENGFRCWVLRARGVLDKKTTSVLARENGKWAGIRKCHKVE